MKLLNPGGIGAQFGRFWCTGAAVYSSIALKLTKGLTTLTDLDTLVKGRTVTTKARYGEEEDAAASEIYALDVRAILKKDVRLCAESMRRARLWTNSETGHGVSLLHNAARPYQLGNDLEYVGDVLYGDALGDGHVRHIDVITALTAGAFRSPVLPIGRAGSLDFATGTLLVPALSDLELYLHEISGSWMIEAIESGDLRTLFADQAALNACAAGGELPEGEIVEGLARGETRDGWTFYWLGDTPQTAEDPDQTLICLLVNPETDEVDAFRTSLNLMQTGSPAVDVSLVLYRDSKSDRMEIEKYNMFFFDTPDGEMSLAKLVTSVLMDREMDMPRPLRIRLRPLALKIADMPVYSLSDCLLILMDGTDGEVSLFDGFYTASFDGDVFESDYTRIEGIHVMETTVTLNSSFEFGMGDDNLIDLGEIFYNPGFALILPTDLYHEMMDALSEAVVYNTHGIGRAGAQGLSFCFATDFSEAELTVYA